MKDILKKIEKYIIIFVAMILVCCAVMVVAYSLPNKPIREHIKESKNLILTSKVDPFFDKSIDGAKMDEFTDLLILNISMNKGLYDNESDIKRAFEISLYDEGNQYSSLEKLMNEENLLNNSEYSRYWHGIQSILRPLLLIFNYEEIRYVFLIIMFILFIISTIYISKNLSIAHAISFAIAMMTVCFFVVPISLQYIGVFAIALIDIILVNILYERNKKNLFPYLFFITGGLTVFFDLLTAPIITLGLPLLMLLELEIKEKSNLKENIYLIIKNSILWSISYLGTFVTKWVIASIILHKNMIKEAIAQILFRANGDALDKVSRIGAINTNVQYLNNKVIIVLFMVITAIWLIMLFKNRKDIKEIKSIIPLILVSIIPYMWYFVFAEHSTMHAFMTYRAQVVFIFGILLAMIESINWKKLKIK